MTLFQCKHSLGYVNNFCVVCGQFRNKIKQTSVLRGMTYNNLVVKAEIERLKDEG